VSPHPFPGEPPLLPSEKSGRAPSSSSAFVLVFGRHSSPPAFVSAYTNHQQKIAATAITHHRALSSQTSSSSSDANVDATQTKNKAAILQLPVVAGKFKASRERSTLAPGCVYCPRSETDSTPRQRFGIMRSRCRNWATRFHHHHHGWGRWLAAVAMADLLC